MPLNLIQRSPARFRMVAACGIWLVVWFVGLRATRAEPRPDGPASDTLALLEARCVKCHGGEKTKGGLDLVTREALLRGGENGASVIPHDANASLLVKMIRHEEDPGMPHKEKKLP